MKNNKRLILIAAMVLAHSGIKARTVEYTMPEENAAHEGTWIQWPHNYLYGPWYRDDVESTFTAMTDALQTGEKVHIIAYDSVELSHIITALTDAGVPLTNIDFYMHPTDDVWSRDNGPVFVYDSNNNLTILDWGFNGWGFDAPYFNCDVIPQSVSVDIGVPMIDLSAMVLEGGAIENDGNGTMMATRSSVTHPSRNPFLTETQIENYLTTYMGITKFIWLDGVYGLDITDMHIDGFVKFANDSTIITMNSADLAYWYVSPSDIDSIYNATNINGHPYNIVMVPLTQNNVITTYGYDLGYKGSYCNFYIANDVVLLPTYNDPNDTVALSIIQNVYPNRTVVGIDVRNLYEYGGMIHCITQQQPVDLHQTGILINEFMANNDTTIADENGDYDDWIELFNSDTEPVNLLGYTLTDDPDEPDKYEFSESVIIEPGDFLLIWADNHNNDGVLHTNFELNSDGGDIGLYDTVGNPVDYIMFTQQSTDISFGRISDGNPEWGFFSGPTPGYANNDPITCILGDINQDGGINIIDIVTAVSFVLGNSEPAGLEFCAGDVNEDGVIDISDITLIINIIFAEG